MSYKCLECNSFIDDRVHDYSTKNYGIPLCRFHQSWLSNLPKETTDDALALYFALKQREVPAQIEKFDGFKTIDIAVPEAKVNIEIDGTHHNWNARQALSDLQRTYYSFKKGYFTLRIPNSLVRNYLDETADMITEILIESKIKTNQRRTYKFQKFR